MIEVEESARGTAVYVTNRPAGDYKHCICSITAATPKDAVRLFIQLCNDNEANLMHACLAWDAGIKRNHELMQAGKRGIDGPHFKNKERLVRTLCKQAGIIDS